MAIGLFACWFQPGLISHDTVFFSHNKPAPARLISPETNQLTGYLKIVVPQSYGFICQRDRKLWFRKKS